MRWSICACVKEQGGRVHETTWEHLKVPASERVSE